MGFATIDAAFGGGTPDYAGQAKKAERKRQARITSGMGAIDSAFVGYNPQFYKNRENAYVDFAMPQLAGQYRNTRNQIGFGLANRGLTQSSAAQSQWSNLARTTGEAKQGIAEAGRGQANELQRQVQTARNSLVSQLYQTADPAQAGRAAVDTAASFRTPSTFAPLANAFSGLLNQYYVGALLNNSKGQGSFQVPSTEYGGGSSGNLGPVTYSSSY